MRLQDIDLNLLVALDALLAERSVTRAARRLGLGQPATSAALARLRVLFGDPLLLRSGAAMARSELAERLAPAVAEALAGLSEALAAAAPFDPASSTRAFTLGSTDYTSQVLLPPLLARLRRDAPGIDLRIRSYAKEEVRGLLAARTVDLVLGTLRPPPEELVATKLLEERLVGLAGRDAVARLPLPLTPAAFATLPFALFTVNGDSTGVGDAALAALGLRRRVALALPHLTALPALLASTDLVSVVPERFARAVAGETLEVFPLPVELPGFEVQLLWPPAARADSGLAWLRRLIAEVGQRV
jgi:DNA-binding transcriptional LysR family regulator